MEFTLQICHASGLGGGFSNRDPGPPHPIGVGKKQDKLKLLFGCRSLRASRVALREIAEDVVEELWSFLTVFAFERADTLVSASFFSFQKTREHFLFQLLKLFALHKQDKSSRRNGRNDHRDRHSTSFQKPLPLVRDHYASENYTFWQAVGARTG